MIDVPVAIALIVSFYQRRAPAWWQVVLGIACGMLLCSATLTGVEKISKDEKALYGYNWGNEHLKMYL